MPEVNSRQVVLAADQNVITIRDHGSIWVQQISYYRSETDVLGRELDLSRDGLCYRWRFQDERPDDAVPSPRNPWRGWYKTVGDCVNAVFDPFDNGAELPSLGYDLACSCITTCSPDYLTDHCNGDDEELIGIPVNSKMSMQDVHSELLSRWDDLAKIPDEITEADFILAINLEFGTSAHSKEPFGTEAPADDDDNDVQMWFRFSWAKKEG